MPFRVVKRETTSAAEAVTQHDPSVAIAVVKCHGGATSRSYSQLSSALSVRVVQRYRPCTIPRNRHGVAFAALRVDELELLSRQHPAVARRGNRSPMSRQQLLTKRATKHTANKKDDDLIPVLPKFHGY